MSWSDWPFERVALLFVGIAFAVVWVQVSLFHWGGAFHELPMWGPVLYAPVLALAGIVFAITMSGALATVGYVIFGIGLVEGLAGVYFHLHGVGEHVLGYTTRNFIAGPPVMLPLTFAALSAFGGIALYWAVR
jgi:hypothetical protein